MIRAGPTLTHILPRTMNVRPPNIRFVSTWRTPRRASRTRAASRSSYAILYTYVRLLQRAR